MTGQNPDDALVWFVILCLTVGTYLFRISFFLLFDRFDEVPPVLERLLRFVPPAVLAALVAPSMVAPNGTVSLTLTNVHLLAGAIAGIVAYRTENLLATITVGLGALWLFSSVLV